MTTESNTWHAADDDLAAYRAGRAGPVLAASLETHLIRCARCRASFATVATAGTETERRWSRLADAVDRPTPTLLDRLGLTSTDHRLWRSTFAVPTMRWAWVMALVLVVGIPLVVATAAGTGGVTMLVALAPLAPVAAVALAYRNVADPAGEIALAAPTAGLRTVALRALAVSVSAVPLGLGTAALLGVPLQLALAWVLPGAALAALVLLTGTTRWDPLYVAITLGGAWALGVALPSRVRGVAASAVADTITSPGLQAAALLIATGALLLTIARRNAVAYRRTA